MTTLYFFERYTAWCLICLVLFLSFRGYKIHFILHNSSHKEQSADCLVYIATPPSCSYIQSNNIFTPILLPVWYKKYMSFASIMSEISIDKTCVDIKEIYFSSHLAGKEKVSFYSLPLYKKKTGLFVQKHSVVYQFSLDPYIAFSRSSFPIHLQLPEKTFESHLYMHAFWKRKRNPKNGEIIFLFKRKAIL